MTDMLYIGSLLGSLIVIGFAVYPIACVWEYLDRKRKKSSAGRNRTKDTRNKPYLNCTRKGA